MGREGKKSENDSGAKWKSEWDYIMPTLSYIRELVPKINLIRLLPSFLLFSFTHPYSFILPPSFARTAEISGRESSNWKNTDETRLSFIGLFLTGEKRARARARDAACAVIDIYQSLDEDRKYRHRNLQRRISISMKRRHAGSAVIKWAKYVIRLQ